MGEALRRVVHAQLELHQQCNAQSRVPIGAVTMPTSLTAPAQESIDSNFVSPGNNTSEVQRRAAIDELYRELRELEQRGHGNSSISPTARRPKSRFTPRRAARMAA